MSEISSGLRITTGRKVAYSLLITLILLMASEAAVRLRAWFRYGTASTAVRDPMLIYDREADLHVPRPGYQLDGERIHIKINSLGFRGDEITRDKPSRVVRIACLGASTTFCSETTSNRATWPYRLQEKLGAAYPGVTFEVINAAVPGYVAADSLKNLRHRVLPLRPDLVVYYEANNEIVNDTREVAAHEGLVGPSNLPGPVALLSKYSLLFDLGYKNFVILAGGRSGTARKIDRIPRNLPDHFMTELDSMREELARAHTDFALSTFLVKYRRGQERRVQIANADVAFFYMPWMSIDGMLDAMDVYNEAILHYARAHDLPVVDDREAIPADAAHYTDCMHFNDRGAEAMANRFNQFLRRSGLVDRLIMKVGAAAAHGERHSLSSG